MEEEGTRHGRARFVWPGNREPRELFPRGGVNGGCNRYGHLEALRPRAVHGGGQAHGRLGAGEQRCGNGPGRVAPSRLKHEHLVVKGGRAAATRMRSTGGTGVAAVGRWWCEVGKLCQVIGAPGRCTMARSTCAYGRISARGPSQPLLSQGQSTPSPRCRAMLAYPVREFDARVGALHVGVGPEPLAVRDTDTRVLGIEPREEGAMLRSLAPLRALFEEIDQLAVPVRSRARAIGVAAVEDAHKSA
mmetsp:Transcript_16461/g.50488  ORF Transcript_16461/g.50488 Transcript_16461/m.50488 type:complete len:246 (-) Transcript_16461:1577-2314(-)